MTVGTEARVTDTVTADMQPNFGGRVMHPVYGTPALVCHMEWAARLVIEPFFAEDEDGVGCGLRIRHLRPAPIGAEISAHAVCTKIDGPVIVCKVQVWHGNRLLGEGEVDQHVLPRAILYERIAALQANQKAAAATLNKGDDESTWSR